MQISVYVLSLQNAETRRAAVTEAFAALGLAFSFVDAIDGRTMEDAEFAKYYAPTENARLFKRPLGRGEVACALGHHLIWQKIAQGDSEIALVCEDDINPRPGLLTFLAEAEKSPERFSEVMIKLDRSQSGGKKIARIGTVDLVLSRYFPPCTGCYLIGRTAARQLLAARDPELRKISRPIDIDLKLYWEHPVPILFSRPSLAPALEIQTSSLTPERSRAKPGNVVARLWRNLRHQLALARGRREAPDAGSKAAAIARLSHWPSPPPQLETGA